MKKRPSGALVISVVALFFAVTGTGIAATHWIITSTSQIKPSVLTALKGKTGARGATGAKGATGDTGGQGAPGAQGVKGDAGAAGATGSQGSTGAQGATGPTGAQGATGTTGATGATGPQGPQGNTGTTGMTGQQGPAGAGLSSIIDVSNTPDLSVPAEGTCSSQVNFCEASASPSDLTFAQPTDTLGYLSGTVSVQMPATCANGTDLFRVLLTVGSQSIQDPDLDEGYITWTSGNAGTLVSTTFGPLLEPYDLGGTSLGTTVDGLNYCNSPGAITAVHIQEVGFTDAPLSSNAMQSARVH